jgi:hypothetical protein
MVRRSGRADDAAEGSEAGAGADSATARSETTRRHAQKIYARSNILKKVVHHSFLENMRYGIHRRRLKPAAIYS